MISFYFYTYFLQVKKLCYNFNYTEIVNFHCFLGVCIMQNTFMPGKNLPFEINEIRIRDIVNTGDLATSVFLSIEHAYSILEKECKKYKKDFNMFDHLCIIDCEYTACKDDFIKYFKLGRVGDLDDVTIDIDKFGELEPFNGDIYWKHKKLPIVYVENRNLSEKLDYDTSFLLIYACD